MFCDDEFYDDSQNIILDNNPMSKSQKIQTTKKNTEGMHKKIATLVKEIVYHQELYYNNQPEISDEEFDALWNRLKILDGNNAIFSEIGKDSSKFFSKTSHVMPMGSLSKVTDESQFHQWISNHPAKYYIIQYKLDGASLELQYKNGILFVAVTRGDGKTGDDILINARNMRGVLNTLSQPMNIAVRGEVIMKHAIYQEYFKDRANCRNAANGLMKRKNGYQVHLLDVVCYDMWFMEQDNNQYSELQKLELLKELGFNVVTYHQFSTEEEINHYRNSIISTRNTIGYDIDGLVIKMPISENDDMASLKPDRQVAYKFPLEYAQTKVLDIHWSESGHLYTPIAILEPVQLAGTTVKRANLVHYNHIQELGINVGAEVLVVKRGEIIPKIERVIIASPHIEINTPVTCSTCESKIENIGTKIFCPNILCRRRLLFRVERWCELLDIDYWGDTLVYKFVIESNVIHKLGDLYRLDIQQLVLFKRIGKPLAEKLLKSLHSKKTISFEVFLAALSIDGVALLTAEKIVQAGIDNWDTLKKLTEEELLKIDTIGPILANNIRTSVEVLENEVQDLFSVVHVTSSVNKGLLLALTGISFCFTGTFSHSRKELQTLIKQNGGIVKNSVSKDLQYLVSNDINSHSDKSSSAKKYGITIISEEKFVTLMHSYDITTYSK